MFITAIVLVVSNVAPIFSGLVDAITVVEIISTAVLLPSIAVNKSILALDVKVLLSLRLVILIIDAVCCLVVAFDPLESVTVEFELSGIEIDLVMLVVLP